MPLSHSAYFFGFTFDFIAELNKAWDWNEGLLFGKILGVVQADVMIWFFLWIFYLILFYQHFIDRDKSKFLLGRRQFAVLGLCILSSVLLVLVYTFTPAILYFDKAYLVLGLLVLIPFLPLCATKLKLVGRTILMIPYFTFVYFVYEITALRLEQWKFTGDYIGWVPVLGVSFPLEELLFWIILSSSISATYYEIGFDNRKN